MKSVRLFFLVYLLQSHALQLNPLRHHEILASLLSRLCVSFHGQYCPQPTLGPELWGFNPTTTGIPRGQRKWGLGGHSGTTDRANQAWIGRRTRPVHLGGYGTVTLDSNVSVSGSAFPPVTDPVQRISGNGRAELATTGNTRVQVGSGGATIKRRSLRNQWIHQRRGTGHAHARREQHPVGTITVSGGHPASVRRYGPGRRFNGS